MENELKKLNRKQLLDLLLKQTERAEQLELKLQYAEEKLASLAARKSEHEELLELKLREAEEKLEALAAQKDQDRKTSTPAEPVTRMDGVLEAALIQYLKNLDDLNRKKTQENIKNADK